MENLTGDPEQIDGATAGLEWADSMLAKSDEAFLADRDAIRLLIARAFQTGLEIGLGHFRKDS